MTKRKGQSILEYIIVLSAIVAAVLAASKELIKPAVRDMMDDASKVIQEKSDDFLLHAAGGSGGDGN
ncbi:MAG: hypothetical protein JSW40_02650 [Candidatus Omnitrophota bacterium]|nr:MAG: hypothetical protein JSW40_02650 [Candidatus Omnitrophota bacterium]